MKGGGVSDGSRLAIDQLVVLISCTTLLISLSQEDTKVLLSSLVIIITFMKYKKTPCDVDSNFSACPSTP